MQMKRLLVLIVGVVLSGAVGLRLGQVSFAVDRSDDLMEQIFTIAGLQETDSTDAKELNALASKEDAEFQNLYLFMFQNVTKGPSEAALAELEKQLKEKKRQDYTKEELRSIVVEGSLEPIIEKWQAVAGELSTQTAAIEDQEAALAAQDEAYGEFESSNEFGSSLQDFYEWRFLRPQLPSLFCAAAEHLE